MSSLTFTPTRPRRRDVRPVGIDAHAAAIRRLHLVPRGDGWSLAQPGGDLVFEAAGAGGRRRCLEFARDHGVASLSS